MTTSKRSIFFAIVVILGISCNNQDADKTKTTKYRIVDLDHHFNLEPMAGRVMMSTDYSYEDFAGSVNFIRDNEKLTNAEKKAILGRMLCHSGSAGYSRRTRNKNAVDGPFFSNNEGW